MLEIVNNTHIQKSKNVIEELLILYKQGQFDEIITQGNDLIKYYPENASLFNILGVTNSLLGNPELAITFLEKSISIEPSNPYPYNNLANILKDLGDNKKSKELLEEAINLSPRYAEAYNTLGTVFNELGKYKSAEKQYLKAINIKPNHFQAYNNLGIVFNTTERYFEAEQSFSKALAINPQFAEAFNGLGKNFNDQNKSDDACRNCLRAIEIKEAYPEAYNNLGLIYVEKGQAFKASEAFEKALDIRPNYIEAHMNLSSVRGRTIPAWHISMMNDSKRNSSFLNALRLAAPKKDLVLEIGTGSGILSMMAIDSGAKKVITCESSKPIALMSEKIIKQNGYHRDVKVINKKSTELVIGKEIPKKVDLIISEILSAELVGEGIQSTVIDANKRLLAKNGIMIPEAGEIMISLLESNKEIQEKVSVGNNINGYDLSSFNSIMAKKMNLDLRGNASLMSKPTPAFTLNLASLNKIKTERKKIKLTATKAGKCLGIIQWIKIKLYKDIEYENNPTVTLSHWPTPLYIFDTPLNLKTGDSLDITGSLLKDSIWFCCSENSS